MPDDDIEIIIEDDPLPGTEEFLADPAAKPAAPERRTVAPEEGVEVLRGQLAAKDAEVAAANARANAAARSEAAARGEVQDTNVSLVETTIAAVKQDLAT